MEVFRAVAGAAAAFPGANIDTDVIMPKQFLKGVDRSGLGVGVFHDLRFRPDGAPNPGFVLNQAPWKDACFLIVGPNFGCGSSREHAVWGLLQIGVRAVIGASFAGIFFDNCANNGLLALVLPEGDVRTLLTLAQDVSTNQLDIDLEQGRIGCAAGPIAFTIDAMRRERFLLGLDPVGATLRQADLIRTFEQAHFDAHPWLTASAQGLSQDGG